MTNISCKKTSGQFDGKIAHDIFVSEIVRIFIDISLKFVLKDLIYKKSALVQEQLGTEQATSHYLNQFWPSPLTHQCGTKGKCVKEIRFIKVWQGHLFATIDKENNMKSTNDKSFLG